MRICSALNIKILYGSALIFVFYLFIWFVVVCRFVLFCFVLVRVSTFSLISITVFIVCFVLFYFVAQFKTTENRKI